MKDFSGLFWFIGIVLAIWAIGLVIQNFMLNYEKQKLKDISKPN